MLNLVAKNRNQDAYELKLRNDIKSAVSNLNQAQVMFFKQMYTHSTLMSTTESIIDNLHYTKLSHILTQVSPGGLFTKPVCAFRDVEDEDE